jgi:hypothetical protein
MSILNNYKVLLPVTLTAGAAGTTTVTSSAVDALGFNKVTFIVLLGTITAGAVTSFKVQQSSDDAATDTYDDLTGTNQTVADTDDDHVRICEIIQPQKRYLKLVIARATQNAVVGVIALLGDTGPLPITQSTSHVIGSEAFLSPVEGTA